MIRLQSIKKEQMFYIETAKQKVSELFWKYPEKEFSLSDIAKEAGVAKANLGVILALLERIGFLKIEKLKKIWRVKANQESWIFKRTKIVYNLNFIYNSGLSDFLISKYHPKSIILFGSFRKGEDNSNSDIDIAIESIMSKGHEIISLADLVSFEKDIGRKIQIHEFNSKNIDKNLFNNIANGIILWGFLEVDKP